jgi:hypothetical protein
MDLILYKIQKYDKKIKFLIGQNGGWRCQICEIMDDDNETEQRVLKIPYWYCDNCQQIICDECKLKWRGPCPSCRKNPVIYKKIGAEYQEKGGDEFRYELSLHEKIEKLEENESKLRQKFLDEEKKLMKKFIAEKNKIERRRKREREFLTYKEMVENQVILHDNFDKDEFRELLKYEDSMQIYIKGPVYRIALFPILKQSEIYWIHVIISDMVDSTPHRIQYFFVQTNDKKYQINEENENDEEYNPFIYKSEQYAYTSERSEMRGRSAVYWCMNCIKKKFKEKITQYYGQYYADNIELPNITNYGEPAILSFDNRCRNATHVRINE